MFPLDVQGQLTLRLNLEKDRRVRVCPVRDDILVYRQQTFACPGYKHRVPNTSVVRLSINQVHSNFELCCVRFNYFYC